MLDPTLEWLLKRGISKNRITDQDSSYVVDGDIVFKKSSYPGSDRGARPNQKIRAEEPLINLGETSTIELLVAVDNSFPRTSWRQNVINGLGDAIGSWNGVSNQKIHFSYTTDESSADIVVRNNPGLSSTNYGQADPPFQCESGYHLDLNNLTELLSRNQLHFLIAHELGHNIGFWHTDEAGGYLIPGTPTSDSQSLMNKGTYTTTSNPANVPVWNGFSSYDVVATQFIYPLTPKATATYNGPTDKVDFTWTTSRFCNPNVTIQMTLPNGNYSQAISTTNDGKESFQLDLPGTYKIRVFTTSIPALEAQIVL